MITQNKIKSVLAFTVVAMALLGSVANAAVLVYEPFDYPADSYVDGLTVNAAGLTGTWTSTHTDSVTRITSPGLSYSTLSVTGGKLTMSLNTSPAVEATLDPTVMAGNLDDGDELWFSFIADTIATVTNNHIRLQIGAGTNNNIGIYVNNVDATTAQVRAAITVGGAETVSDTSSTHTTASGRLVVGRVTFGVTDKLTVYLPEADLVCSAPAGSVTGSLDQSTFDMLRIKIVNGNTLSTDEIRIGETVEDLGCTYVQAAEVDAGVDMITWVNEPVLMDPDISDPNGFGCHWSTDFDEPNAVAISDPDILTPTVTINCSLAGPMPILQNAGFELPILAIDEHHTRSDPVDFTPGWSQSQGGVPDSSIYHGGGAMNYMDFNTYDQVAPEGVNTGYIRTPNRNYDTYLNQHLPIKLQANSRYDMSVLVGQPQKWNSTQCYRDESGPDYHLELVAGGAVVYRTDRTDSPPDAETWDLATLSWTCPPDHTQLGQEMEIRLFVHYQNDIPCDSTYGEYQINFDDVRFTVDGNPNYVPSNTATMTLDVGGVTDTMDIYVYEDACLAAAAAGMAEGYDASDINTDCTTDLADFAKVAAEWLDDYSATGPIPKP